MDGESTTSSGKHLQCLTILKITKSFYTIFQWKHLIICMQFVPTACHPVTRCQWEKPSSVFFTPSHLVFTVRMKCYLAFHCSGDKDLEPKLVQPLTIGYHPTHVIFGATQNQATIFRIQKLCMHVWITQHHARTINHDMTSAYLLATCDHLLALETRILIYKGHKRQHYHSMKCTTKQ